MSFDPKVCLLSCRDESEKLSHFKAILHVVSCRFYAKNIART